jgi:hypothetical protein
VHARARLPEGAGDPTFLGLYAPGDCASTPARRRLGLLVLVALVGVSCSAAVRWQKAGVAAADQQRDETECTSLANRETTIPSASTVGSSPTTSTPYDPQRNRIQTYDVARLRRVQADPRHERAPARP